jgi:transketolase
MKEVFEMFHIQHLRVTEIMSRKGMSQYKVYHFLRTFAAEYPELAEEMKKKGSEVVPEDYKKLLEKVSTLESELKKEKLRADFYEEMVAFGKEVYGIDLKKAGTK